MDPEGCTRLLISCRSDEEQVETTPQDDALRIIGATVARTSVATQTALFAPGHSPVIYTAVPSQRHTQPPSDASTIFRRQPSFQSSTASGDSADTPSSISSLEEDDPDVEFKTGSTIASRYGRGESLSSFRMYSAVGGLCVGIFIQLSSLGANYLLSESHAKHQEKQAPTSSLTPQAIVWFSVVWSAVTAVMGVATLYIIRELVSTAFTVHHGAGRRDASATSSFILQLECYFAIGTLSGVCMAWTCTDLLLGLDAHFVHSFVTLAVALVWCKFITGCFSRGIEQDGLNGQDIEEPLLVKVVETPLELQSSGISIGGRYQLISTVFGLMVGFYIQFSSLGGNYMLKRFFSHDDHHNRPPPSDTTTIAVVCLLWSVAISGMGTLLLFLARKMIACADRHSKRLRRHSHRFLWIRSQDSNENGGEEDEESSLSAALATLESCFAIGALLSVNLAWLGTDLVMGLEVRYWRALITECVVVVACILAMRRRRPGTRHETDACDAPEGFVKPLLEA